ncbi:hypothetical protein HU200_040879 [Digitaria exilis]|uniref:F-box domain-containing protein n=1 Tax=Digitaria exilis TaxID=1010633 RepID=A0A835BFU8_9POAL|nr:hypothetical protein HU200_040879 [Digitaria exilis]
MVKRIKAGSQDVVSSVDRLSDLPDGLIHTVFSFLPAPKVVPTINIDEKDFGIYRRSSRRDALKKRTRFEDFATKLLLRHVDQWIRRGFEYCPSVLNLILRYPRIKLPPVVASNVCHLKKLHLCGVDLDSHFTGLLCSSCPVLEDLELEHCEFYGNSSQGITSPTLKKLVLEYCVDKTGYPFTITVPSLVYLRLMLWNWYM